MHCLIDKAENNASLLSDYFSVATEQLWGL